MREDGVEKGHGGEGGHGAQRGPQPPLVDSLWSEFRRRNEATCTLSCPVAQGHRCGHSRRTRGARGCEPDSPWVLGPQPGVFTPSPIVCCFPMVSPGSCPAPGAARSLLVALNVQGEVTSEPPRSPLQKTPVPTDARPSVLPVWAAHTVPWESGAQSTCCVSVERRSGCVCPVWRP